MKKYSYYICLLFLFGIGELAFVTPSAAQLSVKPCHLCGMTPTEPCTNICQDPLYRFGMGVVVEEKATPGTPDYIAGGFDTSGTAARPRGMSIGQTHCEADANGVVADCTGDVDNADDTGIANLDTLYFEPGDRVSGMSVNPVTAGMQDAAQSEAFDTIYDSMLAQPATIKRIAYRLTEPVVGAVVGEMMEFSVDQVRAQTQAESNFHMKAAMNPEAGEFAIAAYNDCVQTEISNAAATSNQMGWMEASHKCLGGQRVTALAGTTMQSAGLNDGSGYSAQSSKNFELSNPNPSSITLATSLCTSQTNDSDCISALGYILNQAMEDQKNHTPDGQVAASSNNQQVIESLLRAGRRLLGDVNIRFESRGRVLSGSPTAAAGGGVATQGAVSKVARTFRVELVPPMFDGATVENATVLAGPDWYLKSLTRQVYTSIFSIMHYQCQSFNELLTLGSSAGATDMAFPAALHPYDELGWDGDADMWRRPDIRLDANGAVVCTGAPWVTCSGTGGPGSQVVSINRLLLDASAPGMGFRQAIADALFHYFLMHENFSGWTEPTGGGCSGGTCGGGPPTPGNIRPLACQKLNPAGPWSIDNVMDGNIVRKDMPKIVRIVFTYALRVGTGKLWEMFNEFERVIGMVTGGVHNGLAQRYVRELIDIRAGESIAKGKMENGNLYQKLVEGLYRDRANNIGTGDLFQTVMQAGQANQGGAVPSY